MTRDDGWFGFEAPPPAMLAGTGIIVIVYLASARTAEAIGHAITALIGGARLNARLESPKGRCNSSQG